MLKADFDDIESLKKAFDGAYGAFVVTNYWDSSVMDKEKEVNQVYYCHVILHYHYLIIWAAQGLSQN